MVLVAESWIRMLTLLLSSGYPVGIMEYNVMYTLTSVLIKFMFVYSLGWQGALK